MKYPAELFDADRNPNRKPVTLAQIEALMQDVGATRPMGATKRLPSPYTDAPPKVRPTTDAVGIAAFCFLGIGVLLTITGAATWMRWIAEAVR